MDQTATFGVSQHSYNEERTVHDALKGLYSPGTRRSYGIDPDDFGALYEAYTLAEGKS